MGIGMNINNIIINQDYELLKQALTKNPNCIDERDEMGFGFKSSTTGNLEMVSISLSIQEQV